MQTLITIPSGIKDPTYRYKMPKMLLKEESRLNGVKTNIVNIEEVALALRVPSISIMKFMSSELGANMEQTSLVKGKHSYDVMLKHLDKFIEKYVLCKSCRYPELRMFMDSKDLKSSCNSCGKSQIHDTIHKAGKALVNHLKSGGEQKVDITKKDKKGLNEEIQE
jgi:translation initiation factor 5